MSNSPMDEAHKRALVIAYFLSRFDRKGIKALGYASAEKAFSEIGVKLGVKAATIKNMRDSFDPYCSQVRVGWYQRPILPSRANVIQAYDDLSEAAVAEIVREILNGKAENIHQFTAPIGKEEVISKFTIEENSAFVNRMRTGETAETYFMENFPNLERFEGSTLEDTRKLGAGFDFKAQFPTSFQAIEVKGVRKRKGDIFFTDKEWGIAQILKHNYILAIVHSLESAPDLAFITNPAFELVVTMRAIESVSICWNAKI